jgi:hypothetical protein
VLKASGAALTGFSSTYLAAKDSLGIEMERARMLGVRTVVFQ